MNQPVWEQVLDYWFGEQAIPDDSQKKKWFSGGDSVDQEIRQRFGHLHHQLTTVGIPEDWPETGPAILAAIIVIDQFSRNLFRGKREAFAWDPSALSWADAGWQQGIFASLPACQQAFAVLPLVHSEDLAAQDRALKLLEGIKAEVSGADAIITGFYSSAQQHRDIISRFGRYPHRNEVLGRSSTEAERHFLLAGAQRFGQ
ncbi:DUF924 family protein [Reinekea sp. G2M2-21]|uniref:DUF924 family protein n=1 Tax=Reinekea sp. G2M2-21 TaxID=2788942 RepID=UPI0018A9ADD1|nr:DUF924 family protein [Reinekea sp. G2M2-21]